MRSVLKSEIVRAGAGAGKTTELVDKICHYARDFREAEGRFPRFVVTTFTRKATQELRERLVLKALELEGVDGDLLEYVTSTSQVFISTIHGVLRQFLARQGSEIGLVPNFKIVNESDELSEQKKLLHEVLVEEAAFQSLLKEINLSELLALLNQFYLKKMETPSITPVTEADLMSVLEKEFEELAINMRSLAEEIESSTDNQKWLDFSEQMIRLSDREGDLAERVERWRRFREEASKPRNVGKVKPVDPVLAETLSDFWGDLKEFCLLPDWQPEFREQVCQRSAHFHRLGEIWTKRCLHHKVNSARLMQADLELISLELARSKPQSAKSFSFEWDFWFVDEFQDTSPLQVKLFDSLIGDRPSYIVGDPQQSIYLFRGARSEVFDHAWERFERSGFETRQKMKNYRSEPQLMDCLNDLVCGVSHQFVAMEPKDSEEGSSANEVARFFTLSSQEEELQALGGQILQFMNEGVRPSDIAVLARKRSQIKLIASYLASQKIPYQTFVPSGFFDRQEIIDSLNLLKFLCQPHDDEVLVGLLRSPWFRVEDVEIAKICERAAGSLWSECLKSGEQERAFSRLQELVKRSAEVGIGNTWQEELCRCGLIDTSARHDLSGRREANLWKVVSQLRALEGKPGFKYLDFVNQIMSSYVDQEEAEEGDAIAAFEPNRVHIMTAHKSKGLQFDHVLIPFSGVAPQFSHSSALTFSEVTERFAIPVYDPDLKMQKVRMATEERSKLNQRERKENERVLYVALTRAKKSVSMSWSSMKKDSWAFLLQPTLERLNGREGLSYQWSIGSDYPEVTDQEQKKISPPEMRKAWADESGSEQQVSSVTDVVVRAGFKTSEMGRIERAEKIQRGVVIHALLEKLKYLEVHQVAEQIQHWPEEIKKAAEQSLNYVSSEDRAPLMKIIRSGFVEWGFSLKTHGVNLSGQIDLWGEVDGKYYCVDYKTGSGAREQAIEQLKYYADCLWVGKMVSEPQFRLVVVYPLKGESEVVDYEATATRIEELRDAKR